MTLFSITIAKPLLKIHNQYTNVRIIAYADDIYLIGELDTLDRCATEISEELLTLEL